ncbi:50S ribosomal protein L34e [Candidatus Woesearchaeota archaeon]|nr:50S ribosomal protein L34e [Candidatus Woesearchaeota archaeon]
MPRPRHRSRSLRRVQKKMPGGKTRQVYVKKKTKTHKCAKCGIKLKGIPRLSATKAKKISKSKKRPERPYGGFLCNKCAREKLKKEARLK